MSPNHPFSRGCGLALLTLALFLCLGQPALAAGGTVVRKTDGSADGYYYNALGPAAGRYVSLYQAGDLPVMSTICGLVHRTLDQSVITPGVDDYALVFDLRRADPNCPGYADLGPAGLIAIADSNSVATCSTSGAPRTATFGGGGGTPDPLTPFLLTASQPANNDPDGSIDFCGLLMDTSSLFVNSARTQGPGPGGAKTTIGFNHFLEAVVFSLPPIALSFRTSGSSRFAGDRGLPILFARRTCALGTDPRCVVDPTDPTPFNRTDDLVTARIVVDNNTPAPRTLNLFITAFPAVINPKLAPRAVNAFFTPVGGGPPIMNPFVFPSGRTTLSLEIRGALRRKVLPLLPVNLPFTTALIDPNTPNALTALTPAMVGLRPSAGYYDNDSNSGGFFFTQSPVVTGDGLAVRFDAVDLPKVGQPTFVTGSQFVGGEFGSSNLPGIDAFELRGEDPVLTRNPDLTAAGLLRNLGRIGDPGNADGIPAGPPATTVNVDFSDYLVTPTEAGLARNLFGIVFLNPGDTLASLTAIGTTSDAEVLIGNSSFVFGGTNPIAPAASNDHEIRLNLNNELFPGLASDRRTAPLPGAMLRERGRYILVDKERRMTR